MVTKVQLQICFLLGLVYFTKAQLLCPTLTIAELGNTTDLSNEGLLARSLVTGGDSGTLSVPVKINNYKILCDASGIRRDTSSHVSVLIEFQCSFPGGTGNINLAQCDGMTNITRQYQYKCSSSNMWGNSVFVQTLNPNATFQTEPANQCRLCGDPGEISESDPETHCLSCDQTQCDQGQGRCYVEGFMERCCNFYLEEACIAESQCPAPLIANSTTFECGCQSLTLNNGSVSYTNGLTVGSVATHICNSGYRVSGEEVRNCTRDGWTVPGATCELSGLCPQLSIDNGEVIIVPSNRSINSKATYSCLGDYNIKGDRERLCQANGTWSGIPPECEKKTGLSPGEIAGIVIGIILLVALIIAIVIIIVVVNYIVTNNKKKKKKEIEEKEKIESEVIKVSST